MPNAKQIPTREHQVLDPTMLGRPVHLLPRFAAGLAESLAAAMQSGGWRRNWGALRLSGVEFCRAPDDRALRWLGATGARGSVAVALERRLLLDVLNRRYGGSAAPAAPSSGPPAERVTSTEERLAAVLTRQLAGVVHARVAAATGGADLPPAAPAPAAAPGRTAWAIRLLLRDAQSGEQGQCWLAPDQAVMEAILQSLQPEVARMRPARRGEPLASSLQVRLDARLVSKEIALAALFNLKVGDVIPVSVGRADVLLDESRLFTAAVAEHKGKLCLTSFEDAE
jgi:flagellar motor switch protein FliM